MTENDRDKQWQNLNGINSMDSIFGSHSASSVASENKPSCPDADTAMPAGEGTAAAGDLKSTLDAAAYAAGSGDASGAGSPNGQADTAAGQTSQPEAGQATQAEPHVHPLEQWMQPYKRFSVTNVLIAANVAVYVGMAITSFGQSLFAPNGETLLAWGADFAPVTFAGQWWRIITSAFVHIGFMHIVMNMFCLWDGGTTVERLVGSRKMAAIYFCSAIGGSLLSLVGHPTNLCAGASGAVFGIYGAQLTYLWAHRKQLPGGTFQQCMRFAGLFVFYNLFFGSIRSGTDNFAHIGGLLAGAAVGWLLMTPAKNVVAWKLKDSLALAGSLILFAGVFSAEAFFRQSDDMGKLFKAYHLIENRDSGRALEITGEVIKKHPSAMAYFIQGFAHLQKLDSASALEDANNAIALDEKNGKGNDSKLYSLRAAAYELAGDYELAWADAKKALAMNPKDTMAAMTAVSSLGAMDEQEKLNALVESMLTAQPNSYYWHMARAYNLYCFRHFDAALKEIQSQKPLNDHDENMRNQRLAQVFMGMGEYNRARELFKQFKRPELDAGLAACDLSEGKFASAMANARNMQQYSPGDPFSLDLVTKIELMNGDYPQAARDADALAEKFKNSAQRSQYTLLTRLLIARAMKDDSPSSKFPNGAATQAKWPRPVVDYFDGKISEKEMLAQATSVGKETEARAYLGLNQIFQGQREAGLDNLRWVREHGQANYTEYTLALAMLAKLNEK